MIIDRGIGGIVQFCLNLVVQCLNLIDVVSLVENRKHFHWSVSSVR